MATRSSVSAMVEGLFVVVDAADAGCSAFFFFSASASPPPPAPPPPPPPRMILSLAVSPANFFEIRNANAMRSPVLKGTVPSLATGTPSKCVTMSSALRTLAAAAVGAETAPAAPGRASAAAAVPVAPVAPVAPATRPPHAPPRSPAVSSNAPSEAPGAVTSVRLRLSANRACDWACSRMRGMRGANSPATGR